MQDEIVPAYATSRIACIVPTYNGRRDLERLLDSIFTQTASFDLFIVDSASTDGTLELAYSRTPNVVSISSAQFNHGGTRQMMVKENPGYDFYVFMTQDCYLEDPETIEQLLAPFKDSSVGAVCGRQLPHLNANLLAMHARLFNYPAATRIKSFQDSLEMGIKTPFMSNSFSAYRGAALSAVGGFPDHVILSEDMYVAAKMLLSGWKIGYAADACCRHSHNYTLTEEFSRYFDQGAFHSREPWIREHFGGAGGEGLRYVKSELRFLGLGRLHLWPAVIVRSASKLCAYKLGQCERLIPWYLKVRLSMNKAYWRTYDRALGSRLLDDV